MILYKKVLGKKSSENAWFTILGFSFPRISFLQDFFLRLYWKPLYYFRKKSPRNPKHRTLFPVTFFPRTFENSDFFFQSFYFQKLFFPGTFLHRFPSTIPIMPTIPLNPTIPLFHHWTSFRDFIGYLFASRFEHFNVSININLIFFARAIFVTFSSNSFLHKIPWNLSKLCANLLAIET